MDDITTRIDLSLRVGRILGPDYDGVSFEEIARELVYTKTLLKATEADRDEWRALAQAAQRVKPAQPDEP